LRSWHGIHGSKQKSRDPKGGCYFTGGLLDGAIGGVNYDGNDRFCLDGQRLVAITRTYGSDGAEYRTESR
jgi:hypothetical protein